MFTRSFMLVISALYYLLWRSVVLLRKVLRQNISGTIVYLTYHSVQPGQLAKFATQMDMLRRLGIAVLANYRATSCDAKHRVAVTFDDGFRSVADNVIPITTERNIPVTIFVTTGYLGKRAGWIINPEHPNFNEIVLSKQEIEKLRSDMIYIGSHCVSHRNLSHLNSGEIMIELQQSKRTLEDILEKPVPLLSLPYGGCSSDVLDLAREAGYERVFLNVPVADTAARDGAVAGRINILLEEWDVEFKLKALGAYQWLFFAIAAKRRLRRIFEAIIGTKSGTHIRI